jgi:uncharacterized protein (TIGR02391 family)
MYKFFVKYCSNGHITYSTGDDVHDVHCSSCGEKLLDSCPSCNAPIPRLFKSIVRPSIAKINKELYCRNCGNPFPWTKKFHDKLETTFWCHLHPEVMKLARKRFENGQYADSIESVFKAINSKVKIIHKNAVGKEADGRDLMFKAFALETPTIYLSNRKSQSERDIQEGYKYIFGGAMQAIRNPKAHDNIETPPLKAIHLLFLASLLFMKLDERIKE